MRPAPTLLLLPAERALGAWAGEAPSRAGGQARLAGPARLHPVGRQDWTSAGSKQEAGSQLRAGPVGQTQALQGPFHLFPGPYDTRRQFHLFFIHWLPDLFTPFLSVWVTHLLSSQKGRNHSVNASPPSGTVRPSLWNGEFILSAQHCRINRRSGVGFFWFFVCLDSEPKRDICRAGPEVSDQRHTGPRAQPAVGGCPARRLHQQTPGSSRLCGFQW